MRRASLVLCAHAIILVGATSSAWGKCELDKLLASDGGAGDEFGVDVGIDCDRAVVGAWSHDTRAGVNAGAAYVYRFNGVRWVEAATLEASDGGAGDSFGQSVAIDGDVILIGAMRHDANGDNSGAAYVYRFNGSTWVEEAKLLALDIAAGDQFGIRVRLDGCLAIVGAPFHSHEGTGSGAAYVFRYDGSSWMQEAELIGSDSASGDKFGSHLALFGGVAVVGADLHGSGAAYVFRRVEGVWTEEAELLPDDVGSNDQFGSGVSVCAGTAVIGAPWDDDSGPNAGAAYVFRYDRGSWELEDKLVPPVEEGQSEFGGATAINGSTLVISARNGRAGEDAGVAYLYRLHEGGWTLQTEIFISDAAPGDGLSDPALSGELVLLSAFRDDNEHGADAGAAYVIHLSNDLCCPADIDNDGVVGILDFLLLREAWGGCNGP